MAAFTLGHELELQKKIREADFIESLWLHATSSIDVAAARGFSRSLRKELLHMDVRFVSFDAVWTVEEREAMIDNMFLMENLEQEIHVDSFGCIHIPRLFALPAPTPDAFDPASYWVSKGDDISQPPVPLLEKQQVLVRMSSCSRISSDLMSFVGCVTEPGTGSWTKGATVAGLTSGPLSNIVRAHEGSLFEVDPTASVEGVSSVILAAVIVAQAVGLAAISDLKRLKEKHILLACPENSLLHTLKWVLQSLGLSSSSISKITSFDSATAIADSDIIITGAQSSADIHYLRSLASPTCRIYVWDDATNGLQGVISSDPYAIGDALNKVVPILPTIPSNIKEISREPIQYLSQEATVTSKALFDSEKVYLITGGVGSLGIQCAMWMYQVRTLKAHHPSEKRTNTFLLQRMARVTSSLPRGLGSSPF